MCDFRLDVCRLVGKYEDVVMFGLPVLFSVMRNFLVLTYCASLYVVLLRFDLCLLTVINDL